MAELSAVPFDKLPPTGDGYTVLYDNNQVCRSDKKLSELVGARTSSFLTKDEGDSLYQEKGDYLVEDDITGKLDKEQYANDSATFLTAHQNLDEYATMDWVEEQNYITGVDLTNYYTKSETSGKEEIANALTAKQNVIQSKKNSSLPYLETSNSEPSWEVIESEQINAHGTAQEGEVYNTTINGRAYTMVCLNGKLWLAENYVDSTKASYTDSKYGSYFTEATIKLANFVPEGWHLPSKEEYQGLIDYTENHEKYLATTDWHTLDYQGNPDPNYIAGTNELKLNILPGGEYNNYAGSLNQEHYNAYFWTSTDETLSQSTGKQRVYAQISNYIGYNSKIISFDNVGPGSNRYYTVRLIKDDLDVSGPDCWKTFKGKNFMAIADNEGNTFKDFYLKKVEAQATYQPIGSYISSAGVETLNTYYALTTTGWKDIAEDFYDKTTINNSLNLKQDNLSFAGENNTITSINNSAVGGGGGGGVSNSWKQLSEDNHSSGEITGGKFCVYIGKYNSGFNDSYTMGRENYSEAGVNIGYANKINVEADEILPGNVNIGKKNVVLDAGAINIGQNNSAKEFGVNIGENSIASEGSYNIGNSNIATDASINIGESNSADLGSYNIGLFNSAYNAGYTFGQNNRATTDGVAIGLQNSAIIDGFVLGHNSYAHDGAVSIGINCTANNGCFSIGSETSASDGSVIMGNYISANGGSVALGSHISATGGALTMGSEITAQNGATAYGHHTTAISGSVGIGDNNVSLNGSLVIGNGNYAFRAGQVLGIGNAAYSGSTIVGFKNNAGYATVIGNDNNINNAGSNQPEIYTKPAIPFVRPPEDIQIKSFVAGVGNTAYYAKNTYILGHYNKVTNNNNDEYLNTDNDGFTFIYGMRNSADRNWDMAIGYKSLASGGENIAIGVPFETITGYNNYDGGYFITGAITPVAKGYKNIVIRGNASGISNTAINSNLTGNYVTDSDINASVNNSLINSFVQANTIRDVERYGSTYPVTGSLINNTFKNSNVLLTCVNVNYNKFMNDYGISVTSNTGFNFNNFWHNKTIELSGENISKNIFFNNERLHIESPDICRNFIMNMLPYYSTDKNSFTATKLFTDNFMVKTIIDTGDNTLSGDTTLSSVNENFMFNTRIDPRNVSSYRGWGTNSDNDTTLTRNFLVGSYVGKYVYGTVSFADNSDRNTGEMGKISNTIRIFNFGDNTINKAENSLVFGAKNGISAISNSFVFGSSNTVEKTHLHDNTDEYLNNIFLFGDDNKLINDNDDEYGTIVVRNKILGIRNYIKASDRINDNTIIGNDNSINYNVTVPTKSTVISNVFQPTNPTTATSLQGAAFATYRNYILGNCNRVSQCITDSLIVGEGNYIFDTTIRTATDTADYNSIYTLGVGNIAYDGSNQLNIGYNNETSGHFAEAIGDGIVAKGQQLIIGKCNAIVDNTNRYSIEYDSSTSSIKNVEQSGVIFAIGNGTYDYATGTDNWGDTIYYDKDKNVIPSANINNEEYITRSNALIVSANGVVSASDYYTSAGDKLSDLTEIIALLRNKPTTGTHVIKCIDGTLTWVAET